MAIPSSGAISGSDLVAEFGGTAPYSISDYHRGGALVPNIPANNAIPTSGAISGSDFYGTRAETLSLSDHTITGIGSRAAGGGAASAVATLTVAMNGELQWSTDGDGSGIDSGVFAGEYLDVAPIADAGLGYDVMVQVTAGSAANLEGDTVGIWLPAAGGPRSWSVSDGGTINQSESVTFTLSLRRAQDTSYTDSCSITLTAQIIS